MKRGFVMYEMITLPNGVRILTEQVPGVRSAALGVWVGTGSRHEKTVESGSAHFIEHMLFKGTQRRTAAQLAEEMDAIGGQMNAFTTKECTCFYGRVLDTHLPTCADILCDMLFESRFSEEDMANERGVILEEIGMYQDNPEDVCAERLSAAIYKGSALARPILGRAATLEKMTGEGLKAYMGQHYTAEHIVVALAGSFTARDVDTLKERFSALPGGGADAVKSAVYLPSFTVKKKPIEQNHLIMAFPGLPLRDKRRFTLQLLSSILGGGMSSRLWQQVREQRGLCYSIYSYGSSYSDIGLFSIYTALGSETEQQAVRTITDTVRAFAEGGVTEQELERAREQSKANVLMGLESTQARMSNLGRGALMREEILEADELIAAYNAVTADGVRTLAQELFDFSRASFSAVGRVSTAEEYRAFLR